VHPELSGFCNFLEKFEKVLRKITGSSENDTFLCSVTEKWSLFSVEDTSSIHKTSFVDVTTCNIPTCGVQEGTLDRHNDSVDPQQGEVDSEISTWTDPDGTRSVSGLS